MRRDEGRFVQLGFQTAPNQWRRGVDGPQLLHPPQAPSFETEGGAILRPSFCIHSARPSRTSGTAMATRVRLTAFGN